LDVRLDQKPNKIKNLIKVGRLGRHGGATGQVVHLAEGLSEKVARADPIESSGSYGFIGQLDKSKCKNDGGVFMDWWSVQEPTSRFPCANSCFRDFTCPVVQ
jgi:hypothetical protein